MTRPIIFGSDARPGPGWWPELTPGALGSDQIGLEARLFVEREQLGTVSGILGDSNPDGCYLSERQLQSCLKLDGNHHERQCYQRPTVVSCHLPSRLSGLQSLSAARQLASRPALQSLDDA